MDPLDGQRLSIGRFAGLTGISANTLRRYDRLGIVSPAFSDGDTGYRRYSVEQLDDGILVRLLRDLDVPLADVNDLVHGTDPDRLTALLRRHHRTMTERRTQIDHILGRIDAALADGRGLPPYEIETVELAPIAVVSRRARVPRARLDETVDRFIGELEDDLAAGGVHAAGREIVLYHNTLHWYQGLEMEVCLPLEPATTRADAWQLPGGTAVRTLFRGPWDEIWQTYASLLAQIVHRGFDIAGPAREVYLVDERDTGDAADYLTEITWPVVAPGA